MSVLQWQQPVESDGRKVHRVVYKSSRFDPVVRRPIEQRVTLTSEEGLPTPADERVALALLAIAKHTNDFGEPKVCFYPNQVIRLLHWPANSQHYARLRDALRRLKAVTIRYENAWWTAEDRQYEAEFATGIIASYHLARLVRGRKKQSELPPTWVQWHPDFFKSLQAGNLKRLNLEFLLSLKLPIAQRIYRFLDRRFYRTDAAELDLVEFACGHIGLTRTTNVAEIKRRLLPAIVELERRGFIEPLRLSQRFVRLRRGLWRVRFQRVASNVPSDRAALEATTTAAPAWRVVRQWYRLWAGDDHAEPRPKELADARELLDRFGEARLLTMLPLLVERVKANWPDAKTFHAVKPYVDEVAADFDVRAQHAENERRQREGRAEAEREASRRRAYQRALEDNWRAAWEQLAPTAQTEIDEAVVGRQPLLAHMPHQRYLACLKELARRSTARGRSD